MSAVEAHVVLPDGSEAPLESEQAMEHIAGVARNATSGLFDGSQYDLPIPSLDGHKADVLRVALGGAIDLDLYDEHALQFLNSLKLGRENVELTVTFRVSATGWRHAIKGEDGTDNVVHQVALKAMSIDVPAT